MPFSVLVCARCTTTNHPSTRFCVGCDLPLGSVQPDAEAALDALGPYETPEPNDPDIGRLIRELAERSGFDSGPSGQGWRVVVPLRLDRRQAVYIGHAGTDPDGRSILSLVSVCGPASERDSRTLLKLNARVVEGHFAIKLLLGEEYFVVVHNVSADIAPQIHAESLVRRIAEAADGLEERLSRGRDLY